MLAVCVALLAFGPMATAQAGTTSLEGKVTAVKGGAAINNIVVIVSGEGGAGGGSTTTSGGGKYTISGLSEGVHTVTFDDTGGTYLSLEEPIFLEATSNTLDVSLREGSSISGRVTSAATGSELGNVTVSVSGPSGYLSTTTAPNGEYTVRGLSPGTYTVYFAPNEGLYLPQSTSRTLVEGTKETVNAALKEGGKISGTVTDAVTHGGLAKISVSAYSASGEYYGNASTNASGEYTVTGLPTGSYKVSFEWEFSGAEVKEFEKAPRFLPKYITQYYSGQLSAATANPVAATEGAVTSGINAAMVPSLPTNTVLPAVSGTPVLGAPLSCSSGSWTGEPEPKLSMGWPLTSPFGYQWLRDGVAIAGATSDTYVVQAADVGHGLVCEVTATNDVGHASAKSSPFTVAQPVPVVTISASRFTVSANTTKVSIACANAPCVGSVKAVEMIVVKHRKGKRTIAKKQAVVLASGSYSLAAGKTGTITLRLTAAGTKQLAHASHHRVSPKLVVSVTGGKQLEKAVQLSLAAAKK